MLVVAEQHIYECRNKCIICNNTKDYFSWETKKINVKFHEDCENTGKTLKISCVSCHFVKFDIRFLGLP